MLTRSQRALGTEVTIVTRIQKMYAAERWCKRAASAAQSPAQIRTGYWATKVYRVAAEYAIDFRYGTALRSK